MLGPSGKTVSVRQREANAHRVCGSVAPVQIGIFVEDFRLRRHPIGRLVEIQFVAVSHPLKPVMHSALTASRSSPARLFTSGDFVHILRVIFWVVPKILPGRFVKVAAMSTLARLSI